MTLHQFRIFVTVAKHLNVTRASEELHITQSALSRQLRLLAEECGDGLYRVTSRGIELTERGKILSHNAKEIVLKAEDTVKTLAGGHKAEVLQIAGSHSPALSFLPMVSSMFKKTHQNVRIVLRGVAPRLLEQMVLRTDVELGVIVNPSHVLSLVYEPCREETWVAFCSSKHPLAKKRRLSAADLTRVPLVVGSEGMGEFGETGEILREIKGRGSDLNIAMECDSSQGIKVAVQAGMGVGILCPEMIDAEVKRGVLNIIHITGIKPTLKSFIVYSKDRPLSLPCQDFLDLLRQWVRRPGCTAKVAFNR